MVWIPKSEFRLNVARGSSDLQGIELNKKFGRSSTIDTTSGPTDIWPGGGLYTGQPTGAPEPLEIISADAADDVAGTGAQKLQVTGLFSEDDTTFSSVEYDLTGGGSTITEESWYRVITARVTQFGSGATQAGLLTVRHSVTTANVFADIPAGVGRTQIAVFTVPAKTSAYMSSFNIRGARSNNGAFSGTVYLIERRKDSGGYTVTDNWELTQSTPIVSAAEAHPERFPAGTDLIFRVQSVSANGVTVTASFDMLRIHEKQ